MGGGRGGGGGIRDKERNIYIDKENKQMTKKRNKYEWVREIPDGSVGRMWD